jgi:hypothetical protein
MLNRLLILVSLLLLSACASVPMGDSQKDAKHKTFSASPNAAGVYIYRNESFGAAIRMDVLVDGQTIGQSAAKTYFYVDLPPGRHNFTSKSENDDNLTLDLAAGRLYYIWQEVKMGILYARTKLNLMTETEGKAGVLECQLAAANPIMYSSPAPTQVAVSTSKEDQLTELKRLFDSGLITKQVYSERQKAILNAQ